MPSTEPTTATVVGIAEIDVERPAAPIDVAATLSRHLAADSGPLTVTGEASPLDVSAGDPHVALWLHRFVVTLTVRPDQLPGKGTPGWICNYAADVALPGLRRSHGSRARLSIFPAASEQHPVDGREVSMSGAGHAAPPPPVVCGPGTPVELGDVVDRLEERVLGRRYDQVRDDRAGGGPGQAPAMVEPLVDPEPPS